MLNKDLKKQILDISFKHGLSHLGSCLSAVDIIDEIYQIRKYDEKFVLSSGHAALALYVVLQKYNNPDYGKSAEEMYLDHGVHPERCEECRIDCSTGSLGQGLPIAVGMALADRTKNVYCLISDGECAEGSIWEATNIIKKYKIENLKLYINDNSWGAYDKTLNGTTPLIGKLFKTVSEFPFLKDQEAHYHIMSESEYKEGLSLL